MAKGKTKKPLQSPAENKYYLYDRVSKYWDPSRKKWVEWILAAGQHTTKSVVSRWRNAVPSNPWAPEIITAAEAHQIEQARNACYTHLPGSRTNKTYVLVTEYSVQGIPKAYTVIELVRTAVECPYENAGQLERLEYQVNALTGVLGRLIGFLAAVPNDFNDPQAERIQTMLDLQGNIQFCDEVEYRLVKARQLKQERNRPESLAKLATSFVGATE